MNTLVMAMPLLITSLLRRFKMIDHAHSTIAEVGAEQVGGEIIRETGVNTTVLAIVGILIFSRTLARVPDPPMGISPLTSNTPRTPVSAGGLKRPTLPLTSLLVIGAVGGTNSTSRPRRTVSLMGVTLVSNEGAGPVTVTAIVVATTTTIGGGIARVAGEPARARTTRVAEGMGGVTIKRLRLPRNQREICWETRLVIHLRAALHLVRNNQVPVN